MKGFFPLLAVSSVASMIAGLAFIELDGPVRIDPKEILAARNIAAMLLVLPFLETVVFQWMMIESVISVGRRLRAKTEWRTLAVIGTLISCITFAWAHFAMNGNFNGFAYGVEGGVVLSLMYVLNRERGREWAFFSTWMLHTASNGLSLLSLRFFSAVLQ